MKIIDKLNNKMTVSFEFFPPKKVQSESVLFETIRNLKNYDPDYVSVTYGAGGSTRDKTLEWTRSVHEDYGLETMMHLTCIDSTRDSISEILDSLKEFGVENILALRGDMPDGQECSLDEFGYATDLIKFIKKRGDFCVAAAGYPEGHLECESFDKDIEFLKMKQDVGADFIITQLFFDNDYYYKFIDKARKKGVTIPVVAGIMPITNIKQVLRFTEMCGVHVPNSIVSKMNGMSDAEMFDFGVEYAAEQCRGLMDAGVQGLHFYTLNKSRATEEIIKRIF